MIVQVTGYLFEIGYPNISNSFSSVLNILVPFTFGSLQQTSLQYILDEHNKVRQYIELCCSYPQVSFRVFQ